MEPTAQVVCGRTVWPFPSMSRRGKREAICIGTNANKRYPKPSELRRPSNACEIVDTKTVIPNGRNPQSSEAIDRRCVNVTRNAKAASEKMAYRMAKLRRTAAGHHTQAAINNVL